MAVPGKPTRKTAQVGVNPGTGAPKPGNNGRGVYNPGKENNSALANRKTYVRKSAGISPGTHNIGRTPGDAYQPNNNPGGKGMSKTKKGVD